MFSFYACIGRNEGPDDSASRSHRSVLESGTSSMIVVRPTCGPHSGFRSTTGLGLMHEDSAGVGLRPRPDFQGSSIR
jgi:hypothetical protein